MGTFNSVANISARNEKKKKLNPDGKAYVYMHGGVHSPDARSKKRYNVGGSNWIQKAKNPWDYSPTTVKRAQLAKTFKKMAKG